MDAQIGTERTAALCALVQALARLELEEGFAPEALVDAGELLAENRFLAARDGIEAQLLQPVAGRTRPARELLEETLTAVAPHAEALGCAEELDTLRTPGGAERQRALAARGGGLEAVVAELARRF